MSALHRSLIKMNLYRDCSRQRRKHSVFLCLFYVYCFSFKQNLPVVLAEISPVFNESIPLVALSGIFSNEIVESLDHETVELPFQVGYCFTPLQSQKIFPFNMRTI